MKTLDMKKTIAFLFVTIISIAAWSQKWIRPSEAAKYKGDEVSFIGFVNNVSHPDGPKGDRTVMTIASNNSLNFLQLVVYDSDRSGFSVIPETAWLNQYVQVKGTIEMYKGKPQITLHSARQISIVRDGPPEQE